MAKRLQTLLMTPPYHCGVVESAGRWLPLGLASMAGALQRAGFSVEIYDAMSKFHGIRAIKTFLSSRMPDVLCLTACTSTVNSCLKMARLMKSISPGCITIIGGVHPTFMADELLSQNEAAIDYVVRGEGELTLPKLLNVIQSGGSPGNIKGISFILDGAVVHTPKTAYIEDLDSIQPAWDLLDWKDYRYFVIPNSRLGIISTSRGCDNECTFCSQQKFWERTWRARSPEAVMREIELLHVKYGVNVILIADEYPTRDVDRWREILDRLIAASLPVRILMETCVSDIIRDESILPLYKKSGIIHIYIGVEATEQKTLDTIKKNITINQSREAIRLINQQDMITETSFILGFPNETKTSIRETLKLAKYYNPDFAHFLTITPWPYADSYKELLPFIKEFDYAKYNLVEPIIEPVSMSLQEIDNAMFDCYKKFYMSKLPQYDKIKDPFKRGYLLRSMKVMMQSSFLRRKMSALGKMPEEVEKYI